MRSASGRTSSTRSPRMAASCCDWRNCWRPTSCPRCRPERVKLRPARWRHLAGAEPARRRHHRLAADRRAQLSGPPRGPVILLSGRRNSAISAPWCAWPRPPARRRSSRPGRPTLGTRTRSAVPRACTSLSVSRWDQAQLDAFLAATHPPACCVGSRWRAASVGLPARRRRAGVRQRAQRTQPRASCSRRRAGSRSRCARASPASISRPRSPWPFMSGALLTSGG